LGILNYPKAAVVAIKSESVKSVVRMRVRIAAKTESGRRNTKTMRVVRMRAKIESGLPSIKTMRVEAIGVEKVHRGLKMMRKVAVVRTKRRLRMIDQSATGLREEVVLVNCRNGLRKISLLPGVLIILTQVPSNVKSFVDVERNVLLKQKMRQRMRERMTSTVNAERNAEPREKNAAARVVSQNKLL
jgi:hypothetical protein